MIIVITLISIITVIIYIGYYLSKLVIKPKIRDYKYTYRLIIANKLIDSNIFIKSNKKEVWIKSPYNYMLHGIFIPNNKSNKTIVLCHGIKCSLFTSIKYLKLFYKLGFNVLLIDHRFHGKSGGKNTTLGFYEKYDLDEWIKWIRNNVDKNMIIGLHGESMGAAIALQYLSINKYVKFIISDCAFSDLYQLLKYRYKSDYKLFNFPIINIAKFFIEKRTGISIKGISPIKSINKSKTPILFIHGLEDSYIPSDMSIEMFNFYSGVKDILLIENAKHAKSILINPLKYEKSVTNFLNKIGYGNDKKSFSQ